MCGVAGFFSLDGSRIGNPTESLELMAAKLSHRGPDGTGMWFDESKGIGLAHTRLAIIDPSSRGSQPMRDFAGNVLAFNGEIYNFNSLRQEEMSRGGTFTSSSDTEVILSEYRLNHQEFVSNLRGMFAMALWDDRLEKLSLVRDRFGIKPLYYAVLGHMFVFASEPKAILPLMPQVEIDMLAMSDYLTFQTSLRPQTLFKGIHQVLPGQIVTVSREGIAKRTYWRINYELDFDRTEADTISQLQNLLDESMDLHLVSDVEVGSYISGGIDSSLIASMAAERAAQPLKAFHGTFTDYPGYDESTFARQVCETKPIDLRVSTFSADESWKAFEQAIYHLDFPIAGPGSIPQFLVSRVASSEVKVVLGGQGGDEIFGGYARYLVAYLEQCLKAGIEGTASGGKFVVTLESIIPNLGVLREYIPLIQKSWAKGLFGELDARYVGMVSKQDDLGIAINWPVLEVGSSFETAYSIFNDTRSVAKESLFDSMTHFDFRTLLPSLLHVEDRMSMASGLESRVPLLDHKLVEFAATIPSDIKFKDGTLKRLLKIIGANHLPKSVINRRDKMGFPVPLNDWFKNEWQTDVKGLIESLRDRKLDFLNGEEFESLLSSQVKFSRGMWALLSLEMWMRIFSDNHQGKNL